MQKLFLGAEDWVSRSRCNLLSRDRGEVSVGSKPNKVFFCIPMSSLLSVRNTLHALKKRWALFEFTNRGRGFVPVEFSVCRRRQTT